MRAAADSLLVRSLLVVFFFSLYAWSDDGHHHALTSKELGSVHFATSCSKASEADFNRAVALLHSFQYEQADQAFNSTFAKDPKCAMAQWGIAMSNYHGLWDNVDAEKGKAAILKAREIAAAEKQITPREKAYIDALWEIYKPGEQDKVARGQALEHSMGALQAAYPQDKEAAIFHALSLAITAPKTDRTFANQRKCGEILEPIFREMPHHPGVAHYIIHCYDNPVLVQKGLTAARAYAKIAPASAHAHHMPSHIFTRVGAWQESIQSNLHSADTAAKAEATSKNGEARDQRLHAIDYLVYAYLQTGQVSKAKAAMDQMNSLPPVPGLTLTGNYATAAVPARYALELGNWKEASALTVDKSGVPWAQAITWAAIGIGSARSGNLDRAAEAELALATLRDATATQNNKYWSDQVEVQRREVAAWIADANKKGDDAIAMMRSATDLEESMDKHAVTPGAVIPAREMLAQMLLMHGNAKQSLLEYQAVLKLAPKRFNALFGAATAAKASGDTKTAAAYFQQLNTIAVGNEREELKTSRSKTTLARN
ncbi:MAG: repeat protein [Candidatus Angelobacter sp.]|nr:repeat protein [Candidatus Angelobacter sp.]